MPVLPTFEELYGLSRSAIQGARPDLSDFNPGSVLDTISGSQAIMADEVIRLGVEGFSELFFDTAIGDALRRLGQDRLGPQAAPILATPAVGAVTWTRLAAGDYAIPAGTQFSATVNGRTITVATTQSAVILSAETEVDLQVQATTAGRTGNIAAGTIATVLTPIPADTGATVTNAEPLAGGTEAESDDAYRSRIRDIYRTLRRGTPAALRTGALSVSGVSVVTINESLVEQEGIVYVIVGDPDANGNDTQATAVAVELENWRAAGCLVSVLPATREEKPLSINVIIDFRTSQPAAQAAIRAAIVAYGDTLSPGQIPAISLIEKAAHDASDVVQAVEVVSSEAEITPTDINYAVRFVDSQIAISFSFGRTF